jgi:hypothetical protein
MVISSKVVENPQPPRTFSVSKNFGLLVPREATTGTDRSLKAWLKTLTAEMSSRIFERFGENADWPSTMLIEIASHDGNLKTQVNVPHKTEYKQHSMYVIVQAAVDKALVSCKAQKFKSLSMTCKGLNKLSQSIRTMFDKQENNQKVSPTLHNSNTEDKITNPTLESAKRNTESKEKIFLHNNKKIKMSIERGKRKKESHPSVLKMFDKLEKRNELPESNSSSDLNYVQQMAAHALESSVISPNGTCSKCNMTLEPHEIWQEHLDYHIAAELSNME